MAKRAYPEKNVIYTFRWRKGDIETYSVLEFIEELPSGRLLFWNVNYKNYTDMKPERFSYIHRWNLKSERAKVVQQVIPVAPIDKKTKWLSVVNVVESLPKEKHRQFELISTYEPKRFVELLKMAIKELNSEYCSLDHIFQTYNNVIAPWFSLEKVL